MQVQIGPIRWFFKTKCLLLSCCPYRFVAFNDNFSFEHCNSSREQTVTRIGFPKSTQSSSTSKDGYGGKEEDNSKATNPFSFSSSFCFSFSFLSLFIFKATL
eukprot:TRINITY_DN356_c0_g1_i1.p1 TRINITY_DN356_c0_g1~~TRINITY_DN356_c0_g1_i1.p1  ORF type:complete len:102 (+),score=10.42 TRINITY_DN356_c0_g1_i1:193-498(+)